MKRNYNSCMDCGSELKLDTDYNMSERNAFTAYTCDTYTQESATGKIRMVWHRSQQCVKKTLEMRKQAADFTAMCHKRAAYIEANWYTCRSIVGEHDCALCGDDAITILRHPQWSTKYDGMPVCENHFLTIYNLCMLFYALFVEA